MKKEKDFVWWWVVVVVIIMSQISAVETPTINFYLHIKLRSTIRITKPIHICKRKATINATKIQQQQQLDKTIATSEQLRHKQHIKLLTNQTHRR